MAELQPQPTPIPTTPTSVFTTIFVTVIASILGIPLGGGGSASLAQLQQLRDDTAHALDEVKRFAWKIGRLVGQLVGLLYSLYEDLIKKILNTLKDLAKHIKDIYSKVIVPALNALQKIRSMLNDIYNNWLRPIILALQKVRQFLTILRAFGVKWAGDLDARLGRIEAKIAGPYLWLVQQLNGYGGWLNLILTTRATIQKIVFQRSVYENAGTLAKSFWSSQTDNSSAGNPSPAQVAYVAPTLQQNQANMSLYVNAGIGPVADQVNQAHIIWQQKYAAS